MAIGFPVVSFEYLRDSVDLPAKFPAASGAPPWLTVYGWNPIQCPFQGWVGAPMVPSFCFQDDERTGIAWWDTSRFLTVHDAFKGVLFEVGAITLYNLLNNGQSPARIANSNTTTTQHLYTLPIDQSGILQNNPWSLTSAGSSNAFTLTPTVPITALVAGLQLLWIADRAPTGAATLNVSGLGDEPIQLGAAAVTSGQWVIGQALTTMWDGSAWQLISGGGSSGDDEFLAWMGNI